MAVTHATECRNEACDAVVDNLDEGVGANATLEILDDTVVLSTHNMSNPAFGAAASGTATAAAIANATASASGTADKWKAKDTDGNLMLSGDAGQKRDVDGVDQGNRKFTFNGVDLSSEFSRGDTLTIVGSTGNDGAYTVDAVVYAGGNSTIEVIETLASAVADGQGHLGECGLDNTSINSGQTVTVSSFTYTALRA